MSYTDQLRNFPLMQDLEQSELEHLSSLLMRRTVKKGSYILYAEDPGAHLMFVLEGTVKITLTSEEGKEIILAHIGPGEFFGELALLTGKDRNANAVAVEEVVLFNLSQQDFQTHISKFTGFTLALLRELAQRLRNTSAKVGDLVLLDVYQRVARTLKNMGTVSEENGTKMYVIEKRPTHQDLASMVGTSREMVTRALKGLEEEGCIRMEGKRIELHSLPF